MRVEQDGVKGPCAGVFLKKIKEAKKKQTNKELLHNCTDQTLHILPVTSATLAVSFRCQGL